MFSPSWFIEQLGFTVEKVGPTGMRRTIKDKEGNILGENLSYIDQLQFGLDRVEVPDAFKLSLCEVTLERYNRTGRVAPCKNQ